MPFINYGLQKLHFQDTGIGQPLIFLHGLGASVEQIRSILSDLNGFRIITIDMPGHGLSKFAHQAPNGKLSFDYFADCALAVMDALEIASCDIGGISMGSGISINLALRFPERVQALQLVRPAWLDQGSPPHLSIVASVGKWIENEGLEKAEYNLRADTIFQQIEKRSFQEANSILGLFKRAQAHTCPQVLYQIYEDKPFDSIESLKAIQNRCEIYGNASDALHPEFLAKELAASIPNANYHTLPPRYINKAAHAKALIGTIAKSLTAQSI